MLITLASQLSIKTYASSSTHYKRLDATRFSPIRPAGRNQTAPA